MARVELLFFDGCPNHEALERHLGSLLRRPDVELRLRRVESDEDARRIGFLGSPSVRVDGRDVEPGAEARDDFGLKCRLYRADGRLVGVPPDAWIVEALDEGLTRLRTRSALNRLDGVSDAARAVHRRILLAFAAGASPPRDDPGALAELERHDLIGRDETGEIVVAYPFSARATSHAVELDDGTRVFAMCAIDALGIPFMLGRAANIASADPDTGEPVVVEVDPSEPTLAWEPADAVVVYGALPGGTTTCCPFVNFFASERSARAYLEAKPGFEGRIMSMPEAIEAGRTAFGDALG
jgi:hypothetical protein